MIEAADGVAAAADTGQDRVRKPAFLLQHLLFDFAGDDSLKVAHDGREGMRSHHGAEAVMCVADPACPLAEGLRDSVLQGRCAGGHRNNGRAEQTHAIDVQCLPLRILFSHEDDTFHAHQCRGGGCRHTVLAGACLGDQTGFAHFFREKCLPEHVVDLVCARVIQVLAL